ncbi:MAG TPA: IclR family transcriptional regulator [Jiangellaceae bacterium]
MPTEPTPPDHDGAGSGGVRSVQRAVEIMSLLTEQRPAITIREIVEATRLPKTTVLRIVQTLDNNGLLSATPTGYMAGPGLWRWAHLAKTTWEAPAETRALMRDLADRQKETVNIYVVHRLSRVCVVQEESPMPLRHVVKVGDELPLWAGASSKILLQNAGDDLLYQVAAASPFGTDHASTLRAWIAEARDRGFAVSHGEREVGLSAVAVPVKGRFDDVVAALSFSGPTSRFTDDRIDEFAAELRLAATKLTERGFDHPLRTPLDRSSR